MMNLALPSWLAGQGLWPNLVLIPAKVVWRHSRTLINYSRQAYPCLFRPSHCYIAVPTISVLMMVFSSEEIIKIDVVSIQHH